MKVRQLLGHIQEMELVVQWYEAMLHPAPPVADPTANDEAGQAAGCWLACWVPSQ